MMSIEVGHTKQTAAAATRSDLYLEGTGFESGPDYSKLELSNFYSPFLGEGGTVSGRDPRPAT
jgi:hypothetical protein